MRRRRPTPSTVRQGTTTPRPVNAGYVVTPAAAPGTNPMAQSFLAQVDLIRAMTVADDGAPSFERTRDYETADLFALAEIGYHYLMGGATSLARIIFEGLVAIAPNEAYFALACGLAHDHDGEVESALSYYRTASKLDPNDPTPDINRAELYIAARDHRTADRLLARAVVKARTAGDMALYRKASALRSRLSTHER